MGRRGSCHPSEIPRWAGFYRAPCFFKGEITAGTWLLNLGVFPLERLKICLGSFICLMKVDLVEWVIFCAAVAVLALEMWGLQRSQGIGLLGGGVQKCRARSFKSSSKQVLPFLYGCNSGSAGLRICFLDLFGEISWFGSFSPAAGIVMLFSREVWPPGFALEWWDRGGQFWFGPWDTQKFTEIKNFLKHLAARILEGMLKSK